MKPLSLILALALVSATLAAPVPQKRDGEKAIPDLSGECTWGTVTQSREALAIVGSNSWLADGKIRPDGKVELSWTNISSGRLATGLYEWDGKDLIGRYGYVDAEVSEDGTQPTFYEVIRITPIKIVPDL